MKKVLKAGILSVMVLSLSLLAAGQAAPGSLDDQLIQSARNGDTAAVQQLLQQGANIEAKPYGDAALPVAAGFGHVDVVKLLLDKGANIETKDRNGWTPLELAIAYGRPGVVNLLLEKGANPEAALLYAVGKGKPEVVKLLLEKGANPEVKDKYGATALIWAARKGQSDVVKLLLDKGANVEVKDNHGATALINAAYKGRSEVVKLLLEKGVNVAVKDASGHTALSWTSPNQLLRARASEGDWWETEGFVENAEVVRLLQQAVSQNPRAHFAESLNDFQSHPWDNEAGREKVVRLAAVLPTPPPIPEEARQLFLQASALIKQTSTPAELQKPIELLRKALVIAPWWGNAYYNLSRAQELSGDYDEAVKQLNYYIELKPSDAEASEARSHISIIQAEKEATAQRKHKNESILAVKYVSGGATRLHYDDAPAWWHPRSGHGIGDLYTYDVREEEPFYANVFRMPNGKLLAILLVAQSNNGAFAGDKIHVSDITNDSCTQGSEFAFGERSYTEPCGFHYDVSVSNQPNATVTVTYPATGASVTLPVALLYRGRALNASGLFGNCDGTVYQGGTQTKVLHFDCSVFEAAHDPNVNAMGLTPTTVTPYQPNKK